MDYPVYKHFLSTKFKKYKFYRSLATSRVTILDNLKLKVEYIKWKVIMTLANEDFNYTNKYILYLNIFTQQHYGFKGKSG